MSRLTGIYEEDFQVPVGDRRESPQEFDNHEEIMIQRPLVHQALENAARQAPDKVAFICGPASLTFEEVNGTANQVARSLQSHGIQRGEIVGVALDRSIDLVTVLLAVLKTGAAYVPVDPDLPQERISQMLQDADPRIVITADPDLLASTCWYDQSLQLNKLLSMACLAAVDNRNLEFPVRDEDLAYIMYTSGSTGRPKGVEVTHGSVANLLRAMRKEPGCDGADRLLAVTTISFDMAVPELFLPITCQATTVIAQRSQVRDPAELVKLMKQHAITIMQATPTTWQMLLEWGWKGQPRLRKIFCGGEALSRDLSDRLTVCGDTTWNLYGPTESTVFASAWRVRRGQEIIIGRPVHNCYLYVLDENRSPVPVGQPGELYIGGAGVARGYRNRADLSRSSFVPDLFNNGSMYRTGDLACSLPSGEVKLLGRIDRQVKLRGHRVELGDIEAALVEHKTVSDAIAVYREDRLITYYVRSSFEKSNGRNTTSFERALRSWMAGRLPNYMLPAFLIELEAVPTTFNGKIDHKALPDPATNTLTNNVATSVTGMQQHLLSIWAKTLAHNCIGIDDNFFEIGGDSVRLIQVQLELRKLLGDSVPVATLFEHFTIKALAEHLTCSHKTIIPQQQQSPRDKDEDIAIISMSCHLPGGIDTPEDFWQLLATGRDAITEVPEGRWDHAIMTAKQSYRGGFIPSVGSFDLSFFGISPNEARSLDPAQYIMLETCCEGFERAGYTRRRLRGSQTGVFIGTSNILTHLGLSASTVKDPVELTGYTTTGSAGGTMSGRISHQFDLWGPTMTVDTACSSSLVTTHLACNALRQGECDMAVSGGISLLTNPGLHVEFGRLGGMASDGRCRTFDADAEGTGWSEGCVAILLKRVSDAIRDKDTIHAVIKGTAVNHDGRSATLTTPSSTAQQRLIQAALYAAELQPSDIDYVEAHGTATKLGDPIEATALGEVFGPSRRDDDKPLVIGSAKSNIGHTQAAAGLAGLVKVVLSMRHNMLSKTLHVVKPTSAVDWKKYNMTPSLSKQPWLAPRDGFRRAGVSAFGIGGTNAHAILEERPKQRIDVTCASEQEEIFHALPFLLSGDNDGALQAQAQRLRQFLSSAENNECRIQDVAYSLAVSRDHHRRRLVLTAAGKDELLGNLRSAAHTSNLGNNASLGMVIAPKLACMFTGQGSQWLGMGKDLYGTYPVFRETIDTVADEFAALNVPLLEVMWTKSCSDNESLLDRTDFAQASLFALEVALWRLWQSWGVQVEFVIGHSLGEIVAAYVAGVFTLQDACRLVTARGRLMQSQRGRFMMESLEATPFEVVEALQKLDCVNNVDIAAYNTQTQTVVSGSTDAVKQIVGYFADLGRKSSNLSSEHAFHSHFMDDILEEFQAEIETIQFHRPQLNIVSSTTGKMVKPKQLEQVNYWVQQVRSPVRFCEGIEELCGQGVNVFIEVGPRSVLCGLGAACLADSPESNKAVWLPSLKSPNDGIACLQRSIGELHMRHVLFDWDSYFKPFNCRRVELPTYAFQRDFTQGFAVTASPSVPVKEFTHQAQTPTSCQDGLGFEIVWQPSKIDDSRMNETWGLLPSYESNISRDSAVRSALQQKGIRLVDIDLDHLRNNDRIRGLICLWHPEIDIMSQLHELVVKPLAQLQKAIQLPPKCSLLWITRGAVGTGIEVGEQSVWPQTASLWGLMRSAQREHPELRFRLVDLDEWSSTLIAAALRLDGESECAVRKDRLLVPRLQAVSTTSALPVSRQLVQNDGAVLITGGLGYIGSQMARWLAKTHNVRDLVLVSRRGLDADGAKELLAELSALGAKATVLSCDVADPEGVKTIMATFGENRNLRGVIHAAGISDPGVLSTLTAERCAKTLVPKVSGAWLLHRAVQDLELDFFVMLSSISGVLGMPGLANYSAANTFLDALAYFRRARGLPATSVAYGPWIGEGMAARLTDNTNHHLARFGLDHLTPDQGFELFEEAVRSNRPLTVAATLDPVRLREYFHEQSGTPSTIVGLLQRNESAVSTGHEQDLRSALKQTSSREHLGVVLSMTQRVVAKMLGFHRSQDVDVDRPLQELGIDSLTAVQVRNHLQTLTGLTLSANTVMLYPTLMALSQALLSQVNEQSVAPKSNSSGSQMVSKIGTEVLLDSSLRFSNVTGERKEQAMGPKAVFLTGATGFVGTFILFELLKQGIATYCLVRASNANQARERIETTLRNYSLWEPHFEPSINPIVGDMAQDLLGLTQQAFDELAYQVDSVCHCGGLVDWMRPLEDYIGPNVTSMHEIIRLASHGLAKSIHLVSTISTLPNHNGHLLAENDSEYGYGTSKYMAERLLSAACWRGADATVYRLPYVTASSASGHFRRDRGDFLHNLLAGCIMLGAFPILEGADMAMVLPVDYLSRVIVTIMTQDTNRQGLDFDFLSSRSPTCNDFFTMMGGLGGDGKPYQQPQVLPFDVWKQMALEFASSHPASPLARIAAVLDGFVGNTAAGIFQRPLVGRNVLGNAIYPAPPLDAEFVRKYVQRITQSSV